MAGPRDVRAGGAFVELSARDRMSRVLKKAFGSVKSFASMSAKIMAGILGADIIRSLVTRAVNLATTFTTVGSELADMSARTGVSVEALSELGYAAEQTGAGMEALEAGLRKMQKTIVAAGGGGKEATEALAQLGLSFMDLRDLSPEDQFKLIAKRINDIPDATARAAVAMQVLGKGGTALLPMIRDLDALTARARELGLVISTDAANNADRLGDLLDDLWKVIKQGAFVVGAQLAPVIESLTNTIVRAAVATTQWLRENGGSLRAWAQAAVNGIGWVIGKFMDLKRAVNDATGGAIDALLAADFANAGKLAVNQLKIAWLGLTDWFDDLFDGIGDAMVAGWIKGIAGTKSALIRFKDWHRKLVNEIGDAAVEGQLMAKRALLENKLAENQRGGQQTALVPGIKKDIEETNKQLEHLRGMRQKDRARVSEEAQSELDAIAAQEKADLAALRAGSASANDAEKQRLGEEVLSLQAEADRLRAAVEENRRNKRIDSRLDEFFGGVEGGIPAEDDIGDSVGDAVKKATTAPRGQFGANSIQALKGTDQIQKQIADAVKDTADNTEDLARAARRGVVFVQ